MRERRQGLCLAHGRRHADEPNAAVAGFNLVGHSRFGGDLASELRDMYPQAIRHIKAWLDVPDVRDGIEPAGLHRDRAQRIDLEIGQFVAELVRDHPLDGLQALGARHRRHDVSLQAHVALPVLLLHRFGRCWRRRMQALETRPT